MARWPVALVLVALTLGLTPTVATAQTPQWIWTPDQNASNAPQGSCYFRRWFEIENPAEARLTITADDVFEIYINGTYVADGDSGGAPQAFDVGTFIKPGKNLIAVRITNSRGSTAGFGLITFIKEREGAWKSLWTDGAWSCQLNPFPFWSTTAYNDGFWKAAREIGAVTLPTSPDAAASPDALAGPGGAVQPPVPPTTAVSETMPPMPPVTGSAAAPSQPPASQPPTPPVSAPPTPATTATASSGGPLPPIVDAPGATPTGRSGAGAALPGDKTAARAGSAARPATPPPVTPLTPRFKLPPQFQARRILDSTQVPSAIAMTVDEFGRLILSVEGSGLVRASDTDGNNLPDTVTPICEAVKNCQGVLALNGELFVTGDGPDGAALYRLADPEDTGTFEVVKTLIRFEGAPGEHGAHGVTLGPDGMIYVIVGNHAKPAVEPESTSPYRFPYEGDLLPKYEDPSGHAAGIKAPGGMIVRTDLDGQKVETVAGGIRNAYDLTFSESGELFIHDSDMESDIGMTWYRPTRAYHVTPGADMGWRSGWSKWADYHFDALPGLADTGRGSPTGAVVYDHFMFPVWYHGALFLADWSEGRILAVRLTREGATYKTEVETFMQGDPLNVTDLAISPQGGLYVATGGRGTTGGVWHVTWSGEVPPKVRDIGTGLTSVIRQPQLHSAWARQQIALRRAALGPDWAASVVGVAKSTANPSSYRVRALELLQLYGPAPSEALLVDLARDDSADVRATAAWLLGLHPSDAGRDALIGNLADKDGFVRRRALESLRRSKATVPASALLENLASADRHEALAARRLLESMPVLAWRETVMTAEDPAAFTQGAAALIISHPEKAYATAILAEVSNRLRGFLSDRNFVDLLRLTQLTLHLAKIPAGEVPELASQLADEFPAGESQMNRELIKLLVYLGRDEIKDRYFKYLLSDAPPIDRIHVALQLRFLKTNWTADERKQIFTFLTEALEVDGGASFAYYLAGITRDLARTMPPEAALEILQQGERWPHAALGALYVVGGSPSKDVLTLLRALDAKLDRRVGEEAVDRLRLGIVAAQAGTDDPEAETWLHKAWEADAIRRPAVALTLAARPGGSNWGYLLRSLPTLDDDMAGPILGALMQVPQRPAEAEYFRNVIVLGLRRPEQTGPAAVKLIEYWLQKPIGEPSTPVAERLAACQAEFKALYPDEAPAELPQTKTESVYTFDELLTHLNDKAEHPSATKGRAAFEKAKCFDCHRFGEKGKNLGPDLTSVAKRFTRREMLEAIVYPSHVISNQYQARAVATADGRVVTGLIIPQADGSILIRDAQDKTTTLRRDQIDEISSSPVSLMPEGLLDELTLDEIADLFAFLEQKKSSNIATGARTVR